MYGCIARSTKEKTSVTAQSIPIGVALDGIRRVQFEMADILRRAQGRTLQAVGFGPDECPYRVIASGPFWLLRDYGKDSARTSAGLGRPPFPSRPVRERDGSRRAQSRAMATLLFDLLTTEEESDRANVFDILARRPAG